MADQLTSSRPGRSTTSKGATMADQLHMSKKWTDRSATSPERTKVWTEPPPKLKSDKRVAVVYYLCRNGHLEHPHFIEVPLSTPDGLYLRDVINRLNLLRGKGMAALYSWSSKRSYKSGFVWHDLSENDFIYPALGQEYVLKGSELVDEASMFSKSDETVSSRSEKQSPSNIAGTDPDFPLIRRRRNQSWSAIDLHEYKVYKAESTGGSVGGSVAADASTQTDDKHRRRRAVIRDIEEEEKEEKNESTELSRGEISPPPSESSPETLESLMKADGRVVLLPELEELTVRNSAVPGNVNQPTARVKASSVLMQLISCGSISFSDCGPGAYGKNNPGFSLISHYKARLPRGHGENQVGKDAGEDRVGSRRFTRAGKRNNNNDKDNNKIKVGGLEDKEYFSGSLIETKNDEFPAIKRSSSYGADRSLNLELTEEIEGVRAKCIPRKPKTRSTRSTTMTSTSIMCDSQQCSIVKI